MIDIGDVPPSRPMSPAARARCLHLINSIHQDERRRRRRRRTLGTAATLITAAATTGGVAVAQHVLKPAPVTDKSVAHCYSAPTRASGTGSYPGTDIGIAPANGDGPVPIQNAVAACSLPWRDGILRVGAARPHIPDGKVHPVPHLIGCTLEDGTAAVFPGDAGTCERLGLPPIAR
ncbi:MAG: hypothetical protein ACR2JQ_05935 [Mycobacteriales bacterium]